MELVHGQVSRPRCLCLLAEELSIQLFIPLGLREVLLHLLVHLVVLLMSLLHLYIFSLVGHFMILTHFIGCLGLRYLLSGPSILVMLEYCLLIELDMVWGTLIPSLLQDAPSGGP